MEHTVDSIIGNISQSFQASLAEQAQLKVELIRQNVKFHFSANAFFHAQCLAQRLHPRDLVTVDDLARIPLTPVRTFKQANAHVLLSTPLSSIDLELRSTGTSGVPSVARRDTVTTSRAVLSLIGLYREFFDISNGVGLFLCPSPSEAPEMGMVKAFNFFCALLDDRSYLVRNYTFNPAEALEYLQNWAYKQTRHIFGPPFLINRLLQYMAAENIRMELDPNSHVITLGGWKRYTGANIGREAFDQKIQTHLGVRPANIRDMYGMIESNMLAIECEHQRKHVPPWCHVSIRDVADLSRELPPRQTGVIAILDPLSQSYPSYILSEDVGEIDAVGTCPCGRNGQVVVFRRRLQGAELGCCAVSIEKFIDSQVIMQSCAVQ